MSTSEQTCLLTIKKSYTAFGEFAFCSKTGKTTHASRAKELIRVYKDKMLYSGGWKSLTETEDYKPKMSQVFHVEWTYPEGWISGSVLSYMLSTDPISFDIQHSTPSGKDGIFRFVIEDYALEYMDKPLRIYAILFEPIEGSTIRRKRTIVAQSDVVYMRPPLIKDKDTETNTECPICTEHVTESDMEITLCGHVFHHSCLKPVRQEKRNCPLCRSDDY